MADPQPVTPAEPLVLPPDEFAALKAAAAMLSGAFRIAVAGTGPDDMSRVAATVRESAQERTGAVLETDKPRPSEPHSDLLEAAWGVIANAGWDAGTGDVTLAKSPGWHEAAVRWRDDYHRWLDLHLRPGGYQTWEELALSLTRERDALFAEAAQLRRDLRDAAGAEPLASVPDVTLDRAVTLALSAVPAYERHTGAVVWQSPSEGLVRAMLEEAAPEITAAAEAKLAAVAVARSVLLSALDAVIAGEPDGWRKDGYVRVRGVLAVIGSEEESREH